MNNPQSPLKAIRAKCLDCCYNQKDEIKNCPASDCPLFPFRFGKNPYRTKRELSDEERAALSERMKKIHRDKTKTEESDS